MISKYFEITVIYYPPRNQSNLRSHIFSTAYEAVFDFLEFQVQGII
jgi:hypothetical protein